MNRNSQQQGNFQLPLGMNPAAFLNGNNNVAAPHFNVPHLQQLTNFHHRQQAQQMTQHQRQPTNSTMQALSPNMQQPNLQQTMMSMQNLPAVPQRFQQPMQQQPIRNPQQSRQETLQQLVAAQSRGIRPALTMPPVAPGVQLDPAGLGTVRPRQQPVTAQSNFDLRPPRPVSTHPLPNSQVSTLGSTSTNIPEPPKLVRRAPMTAPSSAPVKFVPISEAFAPPPGGIRSLTNVKSEIAILDQSAVPKAKKPRKRDPDVLNMLPRARHRGALVTKPKSAEPPVFFAGVEQVVKESTPLAEVPSHRPDTRHDARTVEVLVADARRRKEEGLRGLMRNEIARLMYGAGDAYEPPADSVEVMEDMVGDFLTDLCRPSPSIRTTRDAPYQVVPLTASIVRHRLASRASMKKYLERFDTMAFKTEELASARRVAALAESHHDLVETVGRSYLGIEHQGQAPVRGPLGRPRKHRPDEGGNGDVGGSGQWRRNRIPKELNGTGERKKPGPAKGWKNALPVDDPRRVKGGYKVRRFGRGAKKESSVKAELKTEPDV